MASKNISISSDNLTVDKTGIYAIAGIIGGYTLSNNNLSALIRPDYDYTIEDPQTILDYYLEKITLTDEEKERLDYNKDGIIDMFDATAILNLVNTGIGKNKPGKFLINANDAYYNIAILEGNGNVQTQVGLAGITTNKLSCPEIEQITNEIEILKQEIEALKNGE